MLVAGLFSSSNFGEAVCCLLTMRASAADFPGVLVMMAGAGSATEQAKVVCSVRCPGVAWQTEQALLY